MGFDACEAILAAMRCLQCKLTVRVLCELGGLRPHELLRRVAVQQQYTNFYFARL